MDSMLEKENIPSKIKRNLSYQERQAILVMLLQESKEGVLKKGTLCFIAAKFSDCPKTIGRIWKRVKYSLDNGSPVDVSSKLKGAVGRKKLNIDPVKVTDVPLRRRSNLRSMATELNISKSALHKRVQEGLIRAHSNAIKPFLSLKNKKSRLKFCLSMLDFTNCGSVIPFNGMYNSIHIDEKWFYMSKEMEKYYLLPKETDPHRTCQSKHFITKVMFLAAVARPRFDATGTTIFSGKIGIFPFVTKEPAKKSSKNRIERTLETKPISVTRDITRRCLIDQVLPTIRSKWPESDAKDTIYIQQDNAKPHINSNDMEFVQAAKQDGFGIQLVCQPSNSPDLNVLDLGFFRAIQSLQHQEAPSNVDELIDAVKKSYESFSEHSLNSVFLTLQSCMIEVMKIGGGNNYKIPHMGKERLQKEYTLPSTLHCDAEIVKSVVNQLQD